MYSRGSNYAEELAHSGAGADGGGGLSATQRLGSGGAGVGGAPGGKASARALALRSFLPTRPYALTLFLFVGCAVAWGFQHESLGFDYLESPLYFEVVARLYGRSVVDAAFAVAAATPQIARRAQQLAASTGSGNGTSASPCPTGGPRGIVSNPAAVVAALSVAVTGARQARERGGDAWALNETEIKTLTEKAVEAAARAVGAPLVEPVAGEGSAKYTFGYREMVQYCPEWATGYIALIALHYFTCAVGSTIAIPLTCRLGARWAVLISGLVFSVFHVALAFFPHVDTYFYLRAAVDVALAANKVPVIVALAEVARPKSRGRVLAALLAAWSVGYCLALFLWEGSPRSQLRHMTLSAEDGERGDAIWRNMHITAAALMLPFALAAPLVPDTPAALMRRGEVVKAYGALRRLRGVRPGWWPGGGGGGAAASGAAAAAAAAAFDAAAAAGKTTDAVAAPAPPPLSRHKSGSSARPTPVPEEEGDEEVAATAKPRAAAAAAATTATPAPLPPPPPATALVPVARLGSSGNNNGRTLSSSAAGSGALARDAVDAEFETLVLALASARRAPACDGDLGGGCLGRATRGGARRARRVDEGLAMGGEQQQQQQQQRGGGVVRRLSALWLGGGVGGDPQAARTTPADQPSLPVAMAVAGVPRAAAALLTPPPAAKPSAAADLERGPAQTDALPPSSAATPDHPPTSTTASTFDAPARALFFARACRPGFIAGLVCGFAYGSTGAPVGRFILPVMVRAIPTLSECGDVPARVVEAAVLAPLIVLGAGACMLLIDRVGRRGWFFLSGGVLMSMNVVCGSLLAVGEAKRKELHGGDPVLTRRYEEAMRWIPVAALAALALFNSFFFVGWYHLSITLPAELQPLQTRVHGLAAALAGQQIGAGLVELFGPPLLCELRAATFFYFGMTIAIAIALFAWLVPETNGVPLEQVQLRAFGGHRVWAGCVLGEAEAAALRERRLAAKRLLKGTGRRGRAGARAGQAARRLFGGGGGGEGGGGKRQGALAAWWARRREAAAWRRAVRAYRHHQGPPAAARVGSAGAGVFKAPRRPQSATAVPVAAPAPGGGGGARGPTPPRHARLAVRSVSGGDSGLARAEDAPPPS